MDAIEQLIEQLERDLTTMNGAQAAATQGLIDSLKKSQRNFGLFDRYLRSASNAAEDFAEYIDEGGESANVFSDVLRESSKQEKNRLKQMTDAASKFVEGTLSNIENIGAGSSESSNIIKSAAEMTSKVISTITNTLSSLGNGIPILEGIMTTAGNVIKGAAELGATAVGFYAGQMEALRGVQRQFYDSGVMFARGIDEARDTIGDSEFLTLGNLAGAAEQASESLRLMAGGAANSLKRIVGSFKSLGDQNTKYLYALGFSNEEIMAGMADFAAAAERNGKALSAKELADGSFAYLKNLKELERLTGVSIKEQKSQAEANRRSLFVQNQLSGLGEKERAATAQFLSTVPAALQDVALTGKGMTQESAILASRLPTYAQGIADITSRLKTGAITDLQASEEYRELMNDPKVAAEIKENQKTFGNAPAELYGSLSGIVTAIGELQAQITGNIEQAKQTALKPEDMIGTLQEGINGFILNTAKLANAFQTTSLEITKFMDPAISSVIDGLGLLSQQLKIFSSEGTKVSLTDEARAQALLLTEEQRRAYGIMTETIDVMGSKFENLYYTKTTQMETKEATTGIKFEDQLLTQLKNVNTEQSEAVKDQIQRLIETLPEELRTSIQQIPEHMIAEGSEGDADRTLNEIYKLMENLNRAGQAIPGYKKEYGWFGGESYVPKNALGNFYPYQPGGKMITVAEAGDEIVAPAKRGSDGKLGLEVSGVMLDSSRLLQSLVKVNENQAAMIAGLTSQMTNMNSNFEKLIQGQRQANRLAV